MTEAEWLTTDDVQGMFVSCRRAVTARKLRLFAAACCRANQGFLSRPGAGRVVEVEERWAEGIANARDMERACATLGVPDNSRSAGPMRLGLLSDDAYTAAVYTWVWAVGDQPEDEFWAASRLRCILGNPFRPVAFDPRWRTADAVGLARGIYKERAFERLPLLADALMDAGCDNEPVLSHCRSAGPHARGCWVVDLVLGKE